MRSLWLGLLFGYFVTKLGVILVVFVAELG